MSVVDRVILCGGVPPPPRVCHKKVVRLQLGEGDSDIHLRIANITDALASELPDVLTDLVEIASYVYCADQAVTRGGNGVVAFGHEWRRRFSFHIPVRAPEIWSSEVVSTELRRTLGDLSEDEYDFHFSKQTDPVPMQKYLEFDPKTGEAAAIDEVILFSGGLDSLGGAVVEALGEKRRIALVSHRANPKIDKKQRLLMEDIRSACPANKPFHVPVWVQKGQSLDREYTQRTRSFLFASLAMVVARAYGLRRIRFYENGVVSLNLPISEQVVGARATRTTHPQVLNGFAALFRHLTQGAFDVENPFLWHTKGEVVDLIGDAGCEDLIRHTVSCTHTRNMTHMFTHCGRCSQCISRRFATLASKYGRFDPAEMYKVDLLTGERETNVDLTMIESFIRTAVDMRTMNEYQLIERFPEISRVLRHVKPLAADEVANSIVRLHQKHAEEVTRVLECGLSRHSAELFQGQLPRTCAMILAFPDKYKTRTVEPGRTNGRASSANGAKVRPDVHHFDTPPGTGWPDILIRFLDGHTVSVVVAGQTKRLTFAEMNMKDGRNANPNKQWKLLEVLSTTAGRLSWSSSAAHHKQKKQVELLGNQLQKFFGLTESPFHTYKKGSGWQIKLRLEALH
jgi:7-cyano-7-deazaguanine synthase in queuosine biosynthesis